MLRTRLWMGAVLVVLAAGALAFDPGPWFPFLFLLLAGLASAATLELWSLLDPSRRPSLALCVPGVLLVFVANWAAHVCVMPGGMGTWECLLAAFAVVVLTAFLVEMAFLFREPGTSAARVALTIFTTSYLGVLPSFLAQLRWLSPEEPMAGLAALALAIFVPKVCDIGAYFTGRFLGRHPMTPVLSPKKTWEGALGGLTAAALTAVLLDRSMPVHWLKASLPVEIAFGVIIGMAAMLGDLAESLIKRDSGRKDASQVVPGFGGILDVVDSVIFPAPLVYLWLRLT